VPNIKYRPAVFYEQPLTGEDNIMETKIAKPFYFKQFTVQQDRCAMKIGTDGVLLGAWAEVSQAQQILDIGTGSGVIALMLAQRTETARIHAVEVETEAYHQACENVQASPWADRLSVYHAAIQDFAQSSGIQYDLIVSNPPFFSGGTFSGSQDRNSVRHTVKLPHGDLLQVARKLLSAEGSFCVILPLIEGLRFAELAQNYHLFCTKMTEVRPKAEKPVERLLMQFQRNARPLLKDSLVVQHEERNDWTEDYIKLTGAFYLNM